MSSVIMEDIQIFETPYPHIIIDNFLQPRVAEKILEECYALEPFYEDAKIRAHNHLFDDCEICKKKSDEIKLLIRDNKVVYMDSIYKDKRDKSVTLTIMTEKIKTSLSQLSKNFPSIFPIIQNTTHMETILSAYGKCDFYDWHIDNKENSAKRIITLVYYVNTEPKKFVGGDICFRKGTDMKKIESKHNRLIIFNSTNAVHEVDTIKFDDNDFKNKRFSIQCWLGFSEENGVRIE